MRATVSHDGKNNNERVRHAGGRAFQPHGKMENDAALE